MRFWCDKCQDAEDRVGHGPPEWHRCQACRLAFDQHVKGLAGRWMVGGFALYTLVVAIVVWMGHCAP